MEEKSFEKAFDRLEEILKKLNDGKINLDDSLKLFEEADGLITTCSKKLNNAEQKIETLIKKRNKILLDEEGNPKTEPFDSNQDETLNEIPSS